MNECRVCGNKTEKEFYCRLSCESFMSKVVSSELKFVWALQDFKKKSNKRYLIYLSEVLGKMVVSSHGEEAILETAKEYVDYELEKEG